MLNNSYVCRGLAVLLLLFGAYLAIFNTAISAVVIGDLSGLGLSVGIAIACGLTGCELWFASWARDVSNWQPLVKTARHTPEKIALKMFFCGLGLALVYHFDIESTRLSVQARAADAYFFLWGLAWLIIGPELTMALGGWLLQQAKKADSQFMKDNNSRDADRAKLKAERTIMIDLATQAGEKSGIAKINERFGPRAE